jgi:hypothetical protein
MQLRVLILGAMLAAAVAASPSNKPDFSGTWRASQSAGSGAEHAPLSISQDGDNITVVQPDSDAARKTEISCNTRGKDCEATVDGNKVKITYWYNGPMLVEMRYEGDHVMKTRRTLSRDGKTMMVEVISIVPLKDPRKLTFERVEDQVRV